MQDYFNYDIFYCMNITDIDDKVRFKFYPIAKILQIDMKQSSPSHSMRGWF